MKRFFIIFFTAWTVSASDFEFPPLFDVDEKLEIKDKADEEFRFLGPLGEYSLQKEPFRELYAFRPFLSVEELKDSYAFDVLWPLFVYRENNFEKYWRFFLLYSGKKKMDDERESELIGGTNPEKPHTGFIPLWLYGRDKDDNFYWAFFPIYGEAKDFLSYDSIKFILFPVYLRTEKGSSEGEAYFWPIVNWDKGDSFRKFRVFPFYAYHDRDGSFSRKTYMWPFYHSAKYYYGTKDTGEGWMLWPLYGENRFKDLKTWSVLWPLFSFHRRESGKGESSGIGFSAPWPLIEYKNNADRDKDKLWKLYIWPLMGRLDRKNSKYQFVLWPFFSSLYTSGDQGNVDWVWLLPLYWSKHAYDQHGKQTELYRNFYPFVSYCEKGDFCEIRIFDLWFQRNMPAVERNWSPLWRIFSYQKGEKSFRYDFLWGALKYYSLPAKSDGFLIFPFYHSRWNFADEVRKDAAEQNSDEGGLEEVNSNNTVSNEKTFSKSLILRRDFLLGLFSLKNWSDGNQSISLFWALEFEL